jgi:hypothetical protein
MEVTFVLGEARQGRQKEEGPLTELTEVTEKNQKGFTTQSPQRKTVRSIPETGIDQTVSGVERRGQEKRTDSS